MSERKVLNKYYPPDFDPNKIPKLKRPRNRQFNIRIMAPFNMRCGTCGEYIYKGKKFNSRQEKVEDEDYLGLMIFRFYIKCPRCVSEISFKTDPKNTDYELEAGATRNFEALRTAEKLAEQEIKEKEDEEKNNPMKVLENRTKSSRQEMEMIETLEELRELNSRHAKVDHENMIVLHKAYEEQLKKLQDEEDEELIRSVFGSSSGGDSVRRIQDFDDEDDDEFSSGASTPKVPRLTKPSDILTQDVHGTEDAEDTTTKDLCTTTFTKPRQAPKHPAVWQKSVGAINTKKSLLGIVKKKQIPASSTSSTTVSKQTEPTLRSKSTEATVGPMPLESMTAPTSEIDQLSTQTVSRGSSEAVGMNSTCSVVQSSRDKAQCEETVNTAARPSTVPAKTGLGLLGAYSDTESDSDT